VVAKDGADSISGALAFAKQVKIFYQLNERYIYKYR